MSAYLKRYRVLRKVYSRFFDEERYQQFAVTDWVASGPALLRRAGIKKAVVTENDVWVRLDGGLELRYVTEIPGAGVEPSVYRGLYEVAIIELILKELDNTSVFFDVGANIGWFCLHVAHVYPEALCHAFEPGNFAFENLFKNVKRNDYAGRIRLNRAAVSDRVGTERLTNNQVGHALNHLVRAETTLASASSVVACTTLDAYCREHKLSRVDLIKCDVEGAELLVIRGGEAILRRYHPKLILEVSQEWMERFGHTPLQLWDILRSYGYCYQIIAEDGSRTCTHDFVKDVGHGANVFFYPA